MLTVYEVGDWGRVLHSEALEALREFPDNAVDALICDPPAGIGWMNRSWDCFRRKENPEDVGRDNVFGRTSRTSPHSKGESDRDRFVAFLSEIMREVYRVLKPGAHGVVWAHSTTSHWTALALEEAGFEVKECIFHVHAQGMPKALNVGLDIDRVLGVNPRVVGDKPWKNQDIRSGSLVGGREHEQLQVKEPTSLEGRQWNGWFSGIKPAVECWWLIQKPISEKNIALNVLKWGVGALNVGATSVARAADDVPGWHESGADGSAGYQGEETFRIREMSAEEIAARRAGKGRFTPNLVLSHHPLCVRVGTHKVKGCPAVVIQGGKDGGGYDVGSGDGTRRGVFEGYGDADGMEEVALYACVPGCAVRELDRQSGMRKSGRMKAATKRSNREGFTGLTPVQTGLETIGDEGGASRFYPQFIFCPKASKSEKEAGLDDLEPAILNRVNPGGLEREERFKPVERKNNHSTCKPLALMRWLCRLVCPQDGVILDPFLGSGTTGAAAGAEGFRFFGIEQGEPVGDNRYVRIAIARMNYWKEQV